MINLSGWSHQVASMERITHKEVTYLLFPDGKILTADYMIPSKEIINEIENLRADTLKDEDADITEFDAMLEKADQLKKNEKFSRARDLLLRAQERQPNNIHVAVRLSSIYRSLNQSDKALQITEKFVQANNSALLTTRAAALLDEAHDKEAVDTARRAYAIDKSGGRHASLELKALFGRLRKEGHIRD